ncbi:hypothetical protein ACN27E_13725 [Mycobacterium sp. WMMD1722]|uniref:hypothetical protein n=1 Tax=Mycobacterium sp. WMMD1722 TaxID=3404117 RepID=UPI003BF5FCFF
MAFTVSYLPWLGLPKDEFGDQAEYEFLEGGVLKVVSPDTHGKVSYTPQTVWMSLFADKGHAPGPKRNPQVHSWDDVLDDDKD